MVVDEVLEHITARWGLFKAGSSIISAVIVDDYRVTVSRLLRFPLDGVAQREITDISIGDQVNILSMLCSLNHGCKPHYTCLHHSHLQFTPAHSDVFLPFCRKCWMLWAHDYPKTVHAWCFYCHYYSKIVHAWWCNAIITLNNLLSDTEWLVHNCNFDLYTVKLAFAATSIKQPPALCSHFHLPYSLRYAHLQFVAHSPVWALSQFQI